MFSDSAQTAIDLKWWIRIFMNGISSIKPSECIKFFERFETLFKDHLLGQADSLPQPTVEDMKSWANRPMLQHWNLYALELQLFYPNPTEFYVLPVRQVQWDLHKNMQPICCIMHIKTMMQHHE